MEPSPISSLKSLFITRKSTPPTRENFAIAFAKLTIACNPNILLNPDNGLSLLALGAKALKEKLNPPINPAAPTAIIKAKVNIGRMASMLSKPWVPNTAGNKLSENMSFLSKMKPVLKTLLMLVTTPAPNKYMKLATPIIIAATESSCERAIWPSSRAFSIRFAVGSSVFSSDWSCSAITESLMLVQ